MMNMKCKNFSRTDFINKINEIKHIKKYKKLLQENKSWKLMQEKKLQYDINSIKCSTADSEKHWQTEIKKEKFWNVVRPEFNLRSGPDMDGLGDNIVR